MELSRSPTQIDQLAQTARDYIAHSSADNTRRAYTADWQHFTRWCLDQNLDACPATPITLALYLTALAQTHKVSTLTRRLSAISQAHRTAGYTSPAEAPPVRLLMAGVRRTHGQPPRVKSPILIPDLVAMLEALPENRLGIRDRALLLLGFCGAFRRSELVALDHEHIVETPEGLVITLGGSKTDQEHTGRKVAIPRGREDRTCPVRALTAWKHAAVISSGAVFRRVDRHQRILPARLSAEAVAIVVKRAAAKLGYSPENFAGHSLRAGLATSAAIAGKSERSIMNQTGHRSTATVRRYIRDGNLFRENAAGGLGL